MGDDSAQQSVQTAFNSLQDIAGLDKSTFTPVAVSLWTPQQLQAQYETRQPKVGRISFFAD